MRKYSWTSFWAFLIFVLAPIFVFAQVVEPSGTDWAAWLSSLMTLKGASAVAIAAAVCQGLLLLSNSSIGKFEGKYQLLAVYVLTAVGAICAGLATGLPMSALLASAPVIAALQNAVHQLIVQFFPAQASSGS